MSSRKTLLEQLQEDPQASERIAKKFKELQHQNNNLYQKWKLPSGVLPTSDVKYRRKIN